MIPNVALNVTKNNYNDAQTLYVVMLCVFCAYVHIILFFFTCLLNGLAQLFTEIALKFQVLHKYYFWWP